MKKLVRILVLLLVIGLLLRFSGVELFRPSTVRAVGNLVVDFHVPEGDPIFTVNDFKPCDVEERTVDITNNYDEPKQISIIGVNTEETGEIANVIQFAISNGSADIYGGATGTKTLKDFFEDSEDPSGVVLAILDQNQSQNFFFTATFECDSGNEFQEKKVVFDLRIGVLVDFGECPDVEGTIKVYYPEGWHAIVGMDENQYGADKVFDIGGNNFVQCYFPPSGNEGIQTNWLAAADFIESQISEFIADGWTFITNGFDWGLPIQEYLAKNFLFTF
ncbi:MAG: hypothetical protein HYT07_00390 [Candidatus Levybacteria bacterium]|nr:hypothetical protein [Candidatus Levybacteria bacterium]